MSTSHDDRSNARAGTPIRLLLLGGSGRMGRSITELVAQDARFQLVATPGRDDALDANTPAFDVAIDFSRPEALLKLIELCHSRARPLVTGTTGMDGNLQARLVGATDRVALVCESNFSLGVAVLGAAVAQVAASLPNWDCDIIEQHHSGKQDAPSGTALALGRKVDAARPAASRPVAYCSTRSGDIVGEHTVQFCGAGERLELTHRATDRHIFAAGALEAAARLIGRHAGRYRLVELLTRD
ncbi:MAG: dihydrodipicolinate reductase C-terminal domain-containing protein [Lysobacteraceae bacterium]